MAKVLLVEDDNNLREIYQARLMAEGYDIVAAQDGEEALVSAKKEHPDLIISDVMMPRISGFEMLDILRNTDELKHTKVIMLTALGQAEDQARADNLGADKYLVKSQVTLEDIVNSAKILLGEAGDPAVAAAADQAQAAAPASAEPAAATLPTPAAGATNTALPAPAPVAPATPTSVPSSEAQTPVSAPTASTPVPVVDEPSASPTTTLADAAVVAEPPITAELEPSPTEAAAQATPEAAIPAITAPSESAPTEPTTVAPDAPSPPAIASTEPSTIIQPTTPVAEGEVTATGPQSIETEEAAMQAQIENFVSTPNQTLSTTTGPTTSESSVATADQAVIANAVKELNGDSDTTAAATSAPEVTSEPATPAPEPTATPPAEPTVPAPAPAEDTSENVAIAHKKIISPISASTPGANLDELLAKEAAKEAGAATPATAASSPPAATTNASFDPNSISL